MVNKTQSSPINNDDFIELLNSCSQPLSRALVYSILDEKLNTLGGWSHVDTEKPNGEYKALRLDNADYQITRSNYLLDSSCNDQKTQSAILVFKYSDWTRQHSSGLEAVIPDSDINFGDVSHVVIDLKINSESTTIPTVKLLRERYADYLTPKQFAEFDNGKVNLGITLFAPGALEQATESLNAELFVEIDQAKFADQWLRLTIPVSRLNFYLQKDYQNTSTSRDQQLNTLIYGLRINPENSNGKQLRNFLGDKWRAGIPETFKEISLTLSRIALVNDLSDAN